MLWIWLRRGATAPYLGRGYALGRQAKPLKGREPAPASSLPDAGLDRRVRYLDGYLRGLLRQIASGSPPRLLERLLAWLLRSYRLDLQKGQSLS